MQCKKKSGRRRRPKFVFVMYISDTLAKHLQENADDLMKQRQDLLDQKLATENSAKEKEAAMNRKLKTVGNYVHDSVPVSQTEDDNAVIRKWAPEGVEVAKNKPLSHHEVLLRIDGYDPGRGSKIVGHRGYCLTGYGVFLNQVCALLMPVLNSFAIQLITLRHSSTTASNSSSTKATAPTSLHS